MKLLKSKVGYWLAGMYLILSAISIYYSRVCIVGICDVGYLLLPAIPWIGLIGDGSYELIPFIISLLINILIFYLIGYFISYLINKKRKINKSKKRK